MKKYRITYIPWWENMSYKDGISFCGWIKNTNKASITGYMICMFNDSLSNVPERNPCVAIEKEVLGSELSTMSKIKQRSYLKKIEKSMFELIKEYKKDLERTGFWVEKYTLCNFNKSRI